MKEFKLAVEAKLQQLAGEGLYRVKVDKDQLWDTYLNSFPPGTNPIFRKRTEHDCSCCRQFIRACGDAVAIVNGELVSIWDVIVGGPYQVVANAMSELVRSCEIDNVFLHTEKKAGTDYNFQQLDNGEVLRFEHFHFEFPKYCVNKDPGTILSEKRSTYDVFYRGLSEITMDSAEIVLDLIAQNSLYRGEEYRAQVEFFIQQKKRFDAADRKDLYAWCQSVAAGSLARVRNTAIGTLLVDLSEGVELDKAVQSFETKVAPTNYKRSSAPITKGMIEKAKKKIDELGYSNSLTRRYALITDLTINNVLFADRHARKAMDVFDEMVAETPAKQQDLSSVEEISIETFLQEVVPTAKTIEVLVENRHEKNLMSLIAPVHAGAKCLLKWDNNFSWAYNGDITDSIRERVKQAGGSVTGDLRCSLSWYNYDDLDIHVIEPDGTRLSFRRRHNRSTDGRLDVDANSPASIKTRTPVENITWPDRHRLQEGTYQLIVNQFQMREVNNVGFEAEMEFGGNITSFHYDKKVVGDVKVAKFQYTHRDGIKFLESLPSTSAPRELWGVQTQRYQRVSLVVLSPNHWDGRQIGNKHWFFIVDGCQNPGAARGLFNEFLCNELQEHRKVLEVLGSKMKAEFQENQLSGLGFSSTQRNHAFFKVTGSFNRILKVNF